ncbi:hypothetical protein PROFUN_07463 [Planoprotostelium fungivorum]|uniref:Right handed beta helix domain-containing protein n=1 Tax=Planoprotostelium fungivorum TaxID=1890364 RepID=A0A2P6NLK5_9EUKA|nr:hypothetical protein PROFUN_07463 [Planoprotostelium fungivorum]
MEGLRQRIQPKKHHLDDAILPAPVGYNAASFHRLMSLAFLIEAATTAYYFLYPSGPYSWQATRYSKVLLYLAGGLFHFAPPVQKALESIVPLPFPKFWIILSGLLEVLLGAAMLIGEINVAAWGIVLLLIALWPANLFAVVRGGRPLKDKTNLSARIFRALFQVVLIFSAYQMTSTPLNIAVARLVLKLTTVVFAMAQYLLANTKHLWPSWLRRRLKAAVPSGAWVQSHSTHLYLSTNPPTNEHGKVVRGDRIITMFLYFSSDRYGTIGSAAVLTPKRYSRKQNRSSVHSSVKPREMKLQGLFLISIILTIVHGACVTPADSTELQTLVDAVNATHYTISLCPGITVPIYATIQPPALFPFLLQTEGLPTDSSRALLKNSNSSISSMIQSSFAHRGNYSLLHVRIDGGYLEFGPGGGNGALLNVGSPYQNDGRYTITWCELSQGRGGSMMQLFYTSYPVITYNFFNGSGQSNPFTGGDGITTSATYGFIAHNVLNNTHDGAIVLFGAENSTLLNNTVITGNGTLLGGINLVDNKPTFQGVQIINNTFIALTAGMSSGIGIGKRIWQNNPNTTMGPILVEGNKFIGDKFGYGITISGVVGVTARYNDISQATFGGNFGTTQPLSVSPTGLQYDPSTSFELDLQKEFIPGDIYYVICIQPGVTPAYIYHTSSTPAQLTLNSGESMKTVNNTLTLHDNCNLVLYRNGQPTFASGTFDHGPCQLVFTNNTLKIWNTQSGATLFSLPPAGSQTALRFTLSDRLPYMKLLREDYTIVWSYPTSPTLISQATMDINGHNWNFTSIQTAYRAYLSNVTDSFTVERFQLNTSNAQPETLFQSTTSVCNSTCYMGYSTSGFYAINGRRSVFWTSTFQNPNASAVMPRMNSQSPHFEMIATATGSTVWSTSGFCTNSSQCPTDSPICLSQPQASSFCVSKGYIDIMSVTYNTSSASLTPLSSSTTKRATSQVAVDTVISTQSTIVTGVASVTPRNLFGAMMALLFLVML